MSQEPKPDCCKVGRTIAAYNLFEFNNELRRRKESGSSLRELAEFMNTRVVERALEDAGVDIVGDPDDIYEKLTDDDVRSSQRKELESKLQQQGVDIEQLQSDFVSHQTMKWHLNDCLDIDTSRAATIDFERERGTIEWSQARCEKVISQSLSRLQQANELQTGSLHITQTVRVTCTDCNRTYKINDLLAERTCECYTDDEAEMR
ncbi:rod-determining factor RdfA [Natronoglomus mannanivorans]|uniref:rod-determining factor RdfA n=1 Tax=Natronoglomus mannanivorans TaxID=2979990 RepID=UPI0030827157